ncbi:MAG: valine--tRNA ligase, partial [Proteobacteria bacterium]|nr:valine--tRNA ligase [Pseudomonadota bacterium]
SQQSVMDRFRREAKSIAALHHPNICPIYDVGEIDGIPFMAMAYIEGRPLSDLIKPGKPLPVICQNGDELDQQRLDRNRALLMSLAKLESIDWLEPDQQAPGSATSLVGDMSLLIPLAGLIDKNAELSRLRKNIQKLEQDAPRLDGKLGNDNFVAKAPAAVVAREKTRLAEVDSALASLRAQADRIRSI